MEGLPVYVTPLRPIGASSRNCGSGRRPRRHHRCRSHKVAQRCFDDSHRQAKRGYGGERVMMNGEAAFSPLTAVAV